jgi:hypothetical protein
MNIKDIIALEEVSIDLKIGEEFYENQNKGLGSYFKDSIMADIESLWLYGIYYYINENLIVIVAILDLRQNPNNISVFLSSRKNNK